MGKKESEILRGGSCEKRVEGSYDIGSHKTNKLLELGM